MPFYNTNGLQNRKLIEAIVKADNQENKVRIIFNFHGKLTASEVHSYFPKNVPLTSIRRAISDLKEQGFLAKTEVTKEGLFGMPEHIYEMDNQLKLF